MKKRIQKALSFSYYLAILILTSVNVLAMNHPEVIVKNKLNFARKEVVSISGKQLAIVIKGKNEEDLRIKNVTSNQFVVLQWVDLNSDGRNDELLFQAEVPAKSMTKYIVIFDSSIPLTKSAITTYSRFVPERTDDYAWENNKVAFRTYGPDAQKRVEENRPQGTLSSGIDLWLKRTEKPIINQWYSENLKTPGYYHIDIGDGYDPYHVGASRGTGGTGIFESGNLLVSKNYISHKTITEGPLRTIFELNYAPWSPYEVAETKRISLDIDSNFSRFEIFINAKKPLPNYVIGITLHDNKGKVNVNKKEGWFRHGEIIDNFFLGEGIIVDSKVVVNAFANVSTIKDQSNLLVVTTPKNDKLTYYAGFAWQKSGQVISEVDWDLKLSQQVKIVSCPLKVFIKE